MAHVVHPAPKVLSSCRAYSRSCRMLHQTRLCYRRCSLHSCRDPCNCSADLPAPQQHVLSALTQIAVFEHVVAAHDVAFVLKTDDDSFVNVPALVADLRRRCTSADCAAEMLYMGYQVLR